MKAELVPSNGDPPIPITKDLTVVGRREYCDIRVDHPSLSKRHCVVVKTDGLLVVRDLGSTNGTKVKGQRVRWAALLPDDLISLGQYKMRVYLGPDDAPGPSELASWGRPTGSVPMPQASPAATPAEGNRPIVGGPERRRAGEGEDGGQRQGTVIATEDGPDIDLAAWQEAMGDGPGDDLMIRLD